MPARAILPGALAALACVPGLARAVGSAPDSAAFAWGLHYRTEIAVRREALGFPWNDEERFSASRDRLAVFGELRAGHGAAVFAKGASGLRIGGEDRDNRVWLEQAHALWSSASAARAARLFARERVFASNHRLMKIVSDESPFLAGRAEGIRLDARAGDRVRLSWIESSLRDRDVVASAGGLPLFRGGADIFRSVRIDGGARGLRAGATFEQVRSIEWRDASLAGIDAAVTVRGATLVAELARTIPGPPGDFADASLFDLEPDAFDVDRPSSIFSENDAFAAEIEGLAVDAGRFGTAGLVPSYRFCGSSFRDVQGEVARGTAETSALLWYRPARLDALLSVTAADTFSGGEGGRYVAGGVRARLRGGVEVSPRIALRDGGRKSASLSLASDTRSSRTRLAILVDDAGRKNDLACFAGSAFNLGARLTAGCSLYLMSPGVVRYALSAEFRTRERFLFVVETGSFVPSFEEIGVVAGGVPVQTVEDRAVHVSGRVRLGGM